MKTIIKNIKQTDISTPFGTRPQLRDKHLKV